MAIEMVNDRKKTPKTTSRKKFTALARAGISTTKRKHTRITDQEGSFLQQLSSDTVCNDVVSSSNAPVLSTQAHTIISSNQEILKLLRG